MATSTKQTPMAHDVVVGIALANTSTSGTTMTFSRFGAGFDSVTPSNSYKTNEKQYINEKSTTTSITSLTKSFAFSADRVKGDTANDLIAGLDDKIGDDLKVKLCVFNMLDKTSSSGAASYTAKVYSAVVTLENPGTITGGESVQLSGTIHCNGDPITGTATINGDSITFTPTT